MPHFRERYARSLLLKSMGHSSVVGVLGQRQVGKTTLVALSANEYVNLDGSRELEFADQIPSLFLENRKQPFGIDEAQLSPALFPAIKEWVRHHPKKSQIILTGSVRFTSRKAIRESLTGRIVNVEVLPLTISESKELLLPSYFSQIQKLSNQDELEKFDRKHAKKNAGSFARYLEKGGLPGICFFRDKSVRRDRFESHLDTLLNRDLQLVLRTTTTSNQLKTLFRFLAEIKA